MHTSVVGLCDTMHAQRTCSSVCRTPQQEVNQQHTVLNAVQFAESEPRCELHCQPTEQELSGMHRNCLGCAACSQNSGQCQFDTKFITDGEGCCEGGKLGRCSPSRTCEISDSSPSCDAAQFPGFLQEKPLPENLTTVQQEFLSAVGGGDRCGVLGLVAVLALVVVLS